MSVQRQLWLFSSDGQYELRERIAARIRDDYASQRNALRQRADLSVSTIMWVLAVIVLRKLVIRLRLVVLLIGSAFLLAAFSLMALLLAPLRWAYELYHFRVRRWVKTQLNTP